MEKEKQQSVVEWYEKEVNALIDKYEAKEISKSDFIVMKHNLFYPAKRMENEQKIEFACKVVKVSADKYIQGKTTEQIAKELLTFKSE